MERAARYRAWRNDEARYRLLVESITDYAIYMLDPTGIVTSWNPGAQRFKGYLASEIIGQHFSRFYAEADRDAGVPREALRIATEEGRFEAEGWRVRKDGSRFWAHVVIDPVRTPGGEIAGFAKITRDLTERRASDAALRESEKRFALLVQGVTDYAIYMLDREGRVSSWNPGAERIKGYTAGEIIGDHVSRFYTPEDQTAGTPARALATAVREGRFEAEGWRVRKDGSRFWAHVILDTIRDEDTGEIIGFAKITRDITERLEAQLALERSREALFQAQKMDAIGQLTGGVAHDFNNLLMAVLGSLELVRKRLPPDPRISPLIENAIQGAQRGATLTQRMLAFARKQQLAMGPVDLSALTEGMAEFLQRTLGPGFWIRTRFPDGLPPALSDPNQIENALLNLAVNARDAMAAGGEIVISGRLAQIGPGHATLRPGAYVALSVADAGVGMDEATLARAAEPFFTTKGVGKGTGLGLSMAHGLAMQSGGALEIVSAPGRGSTIELFFPVGSAAAVAAGPTRSAPEAAASRTLTVLVVDDDSLVLINTAALLEDLGHRVIQVSSGAAALDALAAHPEVDLMITDQAMPQMTGLQLAEAVAVLVPDLPVIIASGYAEALADPGRGPMRLAKPFTQDQLARAVSAALPA